MAKSDYIGQLVGQDAITRYVFGGHARFTLVSKRTGTRYTYRLQLPNSKCKNCGEPLDAGVRDCQACNAPQQYPAPDPKVGPFFAKVLTGPENTTDYEFVGTVRRSGESHSYTHSRKARISAEAPSVRALLWFLRSLQAGKLDEVEVFHDGSCGRCGRPLTVPESVASGLGPICAGRA